MTMDTRETSARENNHRSCMKIAKVLLVQTEAATHVVIRNGAGKKLFDIYLSGVSISVATPLDADITIFPSERSSK